MKSIHILISAILIVGLSPSLAHGYVDPGSGSVIVTAILGFFAAIGYTLRKQFYKLKNIFKRSDKD